MRKNCEQYTVLFSTTCCKTLKKCCAFSLTRVKSAYNQHGKKKKKPQKVTFASWEMLGASENNLRMLLSEMHLVQMDRQIKGFLCKTDGQQHFYSIFLCFTESRCPSLSPLQSVHIRPHSVMSRVEQRWPSLDSVMSDRIIQHLEETCSIFRQTVKWFLGK